MSNLLHKTIDFILNLIKTFDFESESIILESDRDTEDGEEE